MTQQFFDTYNIRSSFKQMGGKAMTQAYIEFLLTNIATFLFHQQNPFPRPDLP
jgi:hypothetical protein